jgi:hypothetical protein
MIQRSCPWPDERDDIALALQALSLDPAEPEVDHPLVELYRALHFSARSNSIIYLSAEHKRLLTDCVLLLSRQV